jgi:hypothetical protein
MANCWYRLNINVDNALSNDWVFPPTDDTWNGIGLWPFEKDKIFSNDWLHTMDNLELPITGSILFYREPNLVDDIAHVDLVGENAKTVHLGFNWVFGGKGSEMIWYDRPSNWSDRNLELTPDGNKFMAWKISDLVEIDRCSIQNELTLVRVDYPHSIIVGDEERWAISARTSMQEMTWDEAVAHLKEKQVLVDR